MAHRTKKTGIRNGQMSRASWARQDRTVERITRREGREACEEGRREAEEAQDGGTLGSQ
jgi:hypothetical protein